MKILPEDYEYMKERIEKVWRYREEVKKSIKNDSRVKDFDRRFRWDMFHLAHLTPFVVSKVYKYADDNHIDTALKKIMAELERS